MDNNIALYVVYSARTLESGYRTGVQSLLSGKGTMFTHQSQLGLSSRTTFRKVLIDLETMKIIAADPSRGRGISLSDMIQKCKDIEPPPG